MRYRNRAWKKRIGAAALGLILTNAAAFPAAAQETYYGSGSYVVGTDIPAGEYALFTEDTSGDNTYSYCNLTLYKDDTDERRIAVLRFQHHGLVTLYNGQHLVLHDGWAVAADQADIEPGVSGMYKAGRDIEPGTYRLTALTAEGGSYALYNDVRYYYDYIDAYGRFIEPTVITVEEGQYLELTDVRDIEKIG